MEKDTDTTDEEEKKEKKKRKIMQIQRPPNDAACDEAKNRRREDRSGQAHRIVDLSGKLRPTEQTDGETERRRRCRRIRQLIMEYQGLFGGRGGLFLERSTKETAPAEGAPTGKERGEGRGERWW